VTPGVTSWKPLMAGRSFGVRYLAAKRRDRYSLLRIRD
jgi:hypothetical protein